MSDDEGESVERQVKIALVGATGVGKTSIVNRYTQDTFSKPYQPSVGVEFYLKRLVLGSERNVNIQLSDIAGAALTGKMTDKYLYGAHAVMLVYDVTTPPTLDALKDWLTAVKRAARHHERPPLFALVANKADLEHMRQVKSERHHRFANDNTMLSYVMSAKTGEGVALTFQKITAELLGVRLSKAEQEQQQPVVRADIVTYQEAAALAAPSPSNTSASTVCSLM